jgi:hypothetical protein
MFKFSWWPALMKGGSHRWHGWLRIGAFLTVLAGAAFWIWRHADQLPPTQRLAEPNSKDQMPDASKPDKTASSPVGTGAAPDGQKTGVTPTDSGDVTESHRPGEGVGPRPETEKDEYILEREPDGRYRIIGRRPRKAE